MTRQEHLQWCKQRAMEYVNRGDLLEGVTSMMSDMTKHDETRKTAESPAISMLGILAMQQAQAGDSDGVRHYIEGFN